MKRFPDVSAQQRLMMYLSTQLSLMKVMRFLTHDNRLRTALLDTFFSREVARGLSFTFLTLLFHFFLVAETCLIVFRMVSADELQTQLSDYRDETFFSHDSLLRIHTFF